MQVHLPSKSGLSAVKRPFGTLAPLGFRFEMRIHTLKTFSLILEYNARY